MPQTTVNNKRITYELRGETHSTETVVLFLHGWGSFGRSFGRLLDTAGEKYLTLAPDLPGFGGSEEPDEAMGVDGFVDAALAFLAQWNPKKVILICHSYGGRMCIKLCARKKLPFAVEKIVLFDAAGILPRRSLGYHLKVKSYKLGKALLKPFPKLLEKFKASRGSADYNAASPVMRGCLVKAVNEDLEPLLPCISAPTLLIWGENDTATPLSDGKKMEKAIPDAGLVVIKGGSHFSFVDDMYTCDRAVRSFLEI